MYLSRLRIYGFKSFAQKVEVQFPPDGITSVVGPNGCGKSNITEAIRWVLGETRARQLRSTRMEDIIFSGTSDRSAMNVCEVSLMIKNDKGVLPSAFSDIQITRRVSRAGESSYFLNNQECRLKDIQNMFFDTGMGSSSYSLMEERMIREVLSDDANTRRSLFEETSGITRYKTQRRESLKQLERVGNDLLRVEDNLTNAKKSLSFQERQMKKAEEWKEAKLRIKTIELATASEKYEKLVSEISTLSEQKFTAQKGCEVLQTLVDTLETQISEIKLSLTNEEEIWREWELKVGERQETVRELQSEVRSLKEKLLHLDENRTRWLEELENHDIRLEELESQKHILNEKMLEQEQGVESRIDIAKGKEERETLKIEVEEVKEESKEASKKHFECEKRITQAESKKESLKEGIYEAQNKLEEISERLEELMASGFEADAQQEEKLSESITVFEDKIESLEESQEECNEQISVWRNKKEDAQSQFNLNNRNQASQNAKLQVLKQLEQQDQKNNELVNTLENQKSQKVITWLKNEIFWEVEYTNAIENCLANFGDSALFEDLNIDLIQQSQNLQPLKGSLSWFKKGNDSFAQNIEPKEVKGASALLSKLRFNDNRVEQLFAPLFNEYYLLDANQDLEKVLNESKEFRFWLADGQGGLWHTAGHYISLGEGANSGGLQRKTEIENLTQGLLIAVEQESKLNGFIKNAIEMLEDLEEKVRKSVSVLANQRAELRQNESELSQLRSKFEVQKSQKVEFENRKEEYINKIENSREEIGELKGALEIDLNQRDFLEEKSEHLAEQLSELEGRKEVLEEELAELEKLFLENKLNKQRSEDQLKFITKEIERIEDRKECLTEEIRLSQQQNSDGEVEALEKRLEVEFEYLSTEEASRDQAREQYEEASHGVDKLKEEQKIALQRIRQITESFHRGEVRLERIQTQRDNLKIRIFEKYEVELDELDVEWVEIGEVEAEAEVRTLQKKLDSLGNVNLSAYEDFATEKKRYEDVEKQFNDLDTARLSLQKTIDKLDEVARERFMANFEQISKNFEEVFTSLMPGGETRLVLEGNDPLDAKISINARPTGKKMRGVNLLSGGERALTATALLFGMYMVKPSPYCILDEVDGPLDDANIGRFIQLLRRFSRQTQFIVITHNKRTMAASDRLYGVTQEIKGISQIAAVQLEEAVDMVQI